MPTSVREPKPLHDLENDWATSPYSSCEDLHLPRWQPFTNAPLLRKKGGVTSPAMDDGEFLVRYKGFLLNVEPMKLVRGGYHARSLISLWISKSVIEAELVDRMTYISSEAAVESALAWAKHWVNDNTHRFIGSLH